MDTLKKNTIFGRNKKKNLYLCVKITHKWRRKVFIHMSILILQ